MVKIDAALFPKTNRMGLGIVIRNHREEFIAACRQCIDKITSPELAEAIAFKRVILFAFGLPYKQVIIATDCLSLIKKLRSVAINVLKALRRGVAPYLLWTPRRGEATPYTNVKAAY